MDDIVNAAGKIATDGFGEISLDLALKHGLVTKEQWSRASTTPYSSVACLETLPPAKFCWPRGCWW